MATPLTKEVSRQCYRLSNRKGKLMIVTLIPGDLIEFRAKGSRTRYAVPLAACLGMAMIKQLEDDYKSKLETYNLKKAAGYKRIRRPKKPTNAWFSPKYLKALNFRS